jgi:hypothetical protein
MFAGVTVTDTAAVPGPDADRGAVLIDSGHRGRRGLRDLNRRRRE